MIPTDYPRAYGIIHPRRYAQIPTTCAKVSRASSKAAGCHNSKRLAPTLSPASRRIFGYPVRNLGQTTCVLFSESALKATHSSELMLLAAVRAARFLATHHRLQSSAHATNRACNREEWRHDVNTVANAQVPSLHRIIERPTAPVTMGCADGPTAPRLLFMCRTRACYVEWWEQPRTLLLFSQ